MGEPAGGTVLAGGLPCLRVGAGRPLVFLPGLTAHHHPPHGLDRWFQVQQCALLAHDRQVWWINRRPGLGARHNDGQPRP